MNLLIWDENQETIKAYWFNEGTEMDDLLEACQGKYINSSDTAEVDEGNLNELQTFLTKDNQLDLEKPLAGPFSRVFICGFLM